MGSGSAVRLNLMLYLMLYLALAGLPVCRCIHVLKNSFLISGRPWLFYMDIFRYSRNPAHIPITIPVIISVIRLVHFIPS